MTGDHGDSPRYPPCVQRVADLLRALEAQELPQRLPHPSADAGRLAADLGVPRSAIALTHLFDKAGYPIAVVSSAAHRPDPITLGGLLGTADIAEIPSSFLPELTDQDPRALAPLGYVAPLDTLVDVELSHHDVVWCPAGSPGWAFPTSYAELLRITAGEAAEVGDLAP